MGKRQLIGLPLGPLLFLLVLVWPQLGGMPEAAQHVAAVAVLMTVWWVSEAIPIPATALLPLALFPILQVLPASDVSTAYANHLVFLFLGGFLIAIAMERWHLHKRIALHIVRRVGTSANAIVFGFMVATAFLSMWISNTATVMMMLPIGLAVIGQAQSMLVRETGIEPAAGEFRFGTGLMLGIAYAGSIGGIATLIGTPPNAILAGLYEQNYGVSIGFADWLVFALPLSVAMLVLVWWYLTRLAFPSEMGRFPGGAELVEREFEELGTITTPEKRVLVVFVFVALAWIGRGIYQPEALSMVSDSTIAIVGALFLFLIPARSLRGGFLLDWQCAVRVPWDIILLFGGGFALARGFADSGLTLWIGEQLAFLTGVDWLWMLFAVTALVIFLTEVTSNTATASLMLPVIGALAAAAEIQPLSLMAPAALAASCAFMLPVATPPNAIVYGSRHVPILAMVRAGLWVNLFAVAAISSFVYLMLPRVLGAVVN